VSGIRLAVLDDGLFVRTYAREIRPLAATFNRFVEAVARRGRFERVRYLVPLRTLRIWEVEPSLAPVDESILEIIPTTFFSGISDYLLRAGYIAWRNWPVIDRAIAESDLLWLRLPASNALLALTSARRHGVPHLGWVAGSVGEVATAQSRLPPARMAARAVGGAYDAVTELAGRGGPLIRLNSELFASVVTNSEVRQTRVMGATVRAERQHASGPARIVWAGRMAGGKGLAELIEAMSSLLAGGADATLVLIGDGPARPSVERLLARLPTERVEDYGYVGDRATYMDLLRSGDLFVHPSRAEGVPKVLVEAMAAGLPVVAAAAGGVPALLADGERGRLVPAGDPGALAAAIGDLLGDEGQRARLRSRGLAWAAEHTAEEQADRLIAWMRQQFPRLAWT